MSMSVCAVKSTVCLAELALELGALRGGVAMAMTTFLSLGKNP